MKEPLVVPRALRRTVREIALLAALAASCVAPPPIAVDGGVDAGVAVVPDGGAASSNTPCAFNRECPEPERCACDEEEGCACVLGARGTGENGVDGCTSGDDCASSVCVEDAEGGFTCSGECDDDGDCEAKLPVCADVAFVGRICIREAP